MPWPWPWTGSRTYRHAQYIHTYRTTSIPDHVTAAWTIRIYMALWIISCNIDILRSLKSCDSFLRRKLKNRAPTSCRIRPIQYHNQPSVLRIRTKTAEEIDLEKCNFRNFRSSVTLTLTLTSDGGSRSYRCAYPVEVYPHTKLDQNWKNFLYTDGITYVRTSDSPGFQ